jgi:hypothetical protein
MLGDTNTQHVPRTEIFGKGDIFVLCTNPECPNKDANWACQRNLFNAVPTQGTVHDSVILAGL